MLRISRNRHLPYLCWTVLIFTLESQANVVFSFLGLQSTHSYSYPFPLVSLLWTRLPLPIFLNPNYFFLFVSSYFSGLLFRLKNTMLSRLFPLRHSGLLGLPTGVTEAFFFRPLGNNNLLRTFMKPLPMPFPRYNRKLASQTERRGRAGSQ